MQNDMDFSILKVLVNTMDLGLACLCSVVVWEWLWLTGIKMMMITGVVF